MKKLLGTVLVSLLCVWTAGCGSAKSCDVSTDCDLGQACSADDKKCVDVKGCEVDADCDGGYCPYQHLICLTYYWCYQDSDCEEFGGTCAWGIEITDFQGNTHPGTCIE